ncbi:MAG TPA: hypothetical protein VHA57_00385 [Actinomycetota bacterium]|nr:hypothetical protein [Actinomycetota bacterium]
MDKRVGLFMLILGLITMGGVSAYARTGSLPIPNTVPSTINQAKTGVAIAGGLAKQAVHDSVSQTATDVTVVQGKVDQTLGGVKAVDPALINGEANLLNTLLNSAGQTLNGTLDGVTTTLGKGLDGVSETVASTTQGATGTINGSLSNATGVLTTVNGLTGAASSGISQTVSNAGKLVTTLTGGS